MPILSLSMILSKTTTNITSFVATTTFVSTNNYDKGRMLTTRSLSRRGWHLAINLSHHHRRHHLPVLAPFRFIDFTCHHPSASFAVSPVHLESFHHQSPEKRHFWLVLCHHVCVSSSFFPPFLNSDVTTLSSSMPSLSASLKPIETR